MSSYYEKIGNEVRCIDEEIPFEIPENWVWCKIKDISQSYIGLTYAPKEVVKIGGIIVLRSSNIQNGQLCFNNIVRVNKSISEKLFVSENDILICARNGSKKLVGKSAIINNLEEPMTFGAFMAICKTPLFQYVYHFLQSDCFFNQLYIVSGTTTVNQLTQENFNNFFIPIPPLSEQERIVNQLNILEPQIQMYDKYEQEETQLQSSFPNNLKKSILQYAIQGKLVSQNSEDESASVLLAKIRKEKQKLIKQGKIKPDKNESFIYKNTEDNSYYESYNGSILCIDDQIPFEIPDNWVWCRLYSIVDYIQRGKSPKYSDIRQYPVIAQKCNQWSGISLEKALFIDPQTISKYTPERFLQSGDILVNSTGTGTLGRTGYYTDDIKGNYNCIVADSHVTVIRCNGFVYSKYIYYFFCSPFVQNEIENKADGSTNQIELNTETIKSYIIPLPPLSEQKSIVNKIEKLIASLS